MKWTQRLLILMLVTTLGIPQLPAQSEVPPEPPDPGDTWLMQIVLLVGKTRGPSNVENLTKNARKAIEDIQDFLPFKSYQLMDMGLIRTARNARGKLKDQTGRVYDFELSFEKEGRGPSERLVFHNFRLTQFIPAHINERAGGAVAPRADEEIIRTSFSMNVGETIVVGTSKLDGGDEALIVLLTAIP